MLLSRTMQLREPSRATAAERSILATPVGGAAPPNAVTCGSRSIATTPKPHSRDRSRCSGNEEKEED